MTTEPTAEGTPNADDLMAEVAEWRAIAGAALGLDGDALDTARDDAVTYTRSGDIRVMLPAGGDPEPTTEGDPAPTTEGNPAPTTEGDPAPTTNPPVRRPPRRAPEGAMAAGNASLSASDRVDAFMAETDPAKFAANRQAMYQAMAEVEASAGRK